MKSKKFLAFALLFVLLCEQVIQPIRVSAIEDNLRPFYSSNDITMFDPNDCTLAGNTDAGAVQLKGDTTIEKILNFFMSGDRGLSLAQAAGIVGNMARESGHGVDSKTGVNLPNPAKEQGGAIVGDDYVPKNGKGFGLVQWTFSSRQQPLIDLRADGHPPIGLRLELEQQIKIDVAAILRWQSPDHVALAASALASVELGADPFHPAKIEPGRHGVGDEIPNQLFDHHRMGEQAVVQRIMVSHRHSVA